LRTVLIDGDIFIFQASSANEYETQWEPWLWTLHADLNAAIAQFDDTLASIVEDLQADKVVVALSDEVNWRKSVMPSYKHNRVSKRKPVIYKAMREYVSETRDTFQRPGLEGDDILGILSTHAHLVKGEKIIVSLDKDMQTIPGRLLNDGRARKAIAENGGTYADHIREVSASEADFYHMMQTLTGDVTDGYPGCPGIGPVKAEELLVGGLVLEPREFLCTRGVNKGTKQIKWELGKPGTQWEIVVSAYASAGLSEEVALQNARVARIARASDYDFTKKEIVLWTPQKA
jgi:5'-3' exonuclease